MRLLYVTDAIGCARIVSQGFAPDDCFMGDDGILMYTGRPRAGGREVLAIHLPDDVADQYAYRRGGADADEPPLFYRLPLDVANRYLLGD